MAAVMRRGWRGGKEKITPFRIRVQQWKVRSIFMAEHKVVLGWEREGE